MYPRRTGSGVPPIDAYQMASYNVARYYDMTDLHGIIATGRYATLNFLKDEYNPVPTDVLSKGKWLKRENESTEPFPPSIGHLLKRSLRTSISTNRISHLKIRLESKCSTTSLQNRIM